MKYLLLVLSLVVCTALLGMLFKAPPTQQTDATPVPELLKTQQTTEESLFCQKTQKARKVYRVLHHWIVKEYSDGHLHSSQSVDTVLVGEISLNDPCPAELAAVWK